MTRHGTLCILVLGVITVAMCTAFAGPGASAPARAGEEPPQRDGEYERFLTENAVQKERITAIELAVAEDEELETVLTAYADSLGDHPELAEIESSLAEAAEQDKTLLQLETEFAELSAENPESIAQTAALDSALAADSNLAKDLQALEQAAAAAPELLEEHGEAMAALETHPEEAEAIFVEESGPTYIGTDPEIAAYVRYLAAHPTLYRAWWRVHEHLRTRPALRRIVHGNWRWYGSQPRLWRARWTHRLRASQVARYHRAHWKRRLYVGRHPGLARAIGHHRALIAARPELRSHARFLRRHPQTAKAVVQHRRWVKQHHPHLAKPPPKTRAKPAREAPDRPPRRKPQKKTKAKTHRH